ncbi:hypothetical protein F2Q70_00028670 [Brassica cretica]|uniref:Uncharacterized protein n=2 Tax=Brassica TaxID=3705 RepID=A0A8S9L524_BRACR|nr:hypothetical protein F2Q70_00028670 [Brassica cretica]
MVETLGPSVLPYLPKALEQLLADSEVRKTVKHMIMAVVLRTRIALPIVNLSDSNWGEFVYQGKGKILSVAAGQIL